MDGQKGWGSTGVEMMTKEVFDDERREVMAKKWKTLCISIIVIIFITTLS